MDKRTERQEDNQYAEKCGNPLLDWGEFSGAGRTEHSLLLLRQRNI